MDTNNNFESTLAEFIAIPTVANEKEANSLGISFITNVLKSLGFIISIEGESPFYQPVIVAKYNNTKSDKKVVLYGHYDVEKIKDSENWSTPPFELTENQERYFCRGIADNKGVLLARIFAIREMIESNEQLPNILWIIQGEEEIEGKTPFEVIPRHYKNFGSKVYVEETGMYKDGKPLILYLPKAEKQPDFLDDLNESIYNGEASFENRKLNKFSECPFLINIPEDGYYIAFGPNDGQCNIHQENESIDKQKLEDHIQVFRKFMRWVNKAEIA